MTVAPSITDVLLEINNPDVERDPGNCVDRQYQYCGAREEQKVVRQPMAAVFSGVALGIDESIVGSRGLFDVSFLRSFRRRAPADDLPVALNYSRLVGSFPPPQPVEYRPTGTPSLNFGAHLGDIAMLLQYFATHGADCPTNR